MTASKARLIVVKLSITALLLYAFLGRTEFARIWRLLSHYSFTVILSVSLLNVGAVLISAWKWRLLLPETRFRHLLAACFASYYVGLLLPGQLAQEGAKAFYAARRRSLNRARL